MCVKTFLPLYTLWQRSMPPPVIRLVVHNGNNYNETDKQTTSPPDQGDPLTPALADVTLLSNLFFITRWFQGFPRGVIGSLHSIGFREPANRL